MHHIINWSLVSVLSFGLSSGSAAQTKKYIHFDGSGKEFVPKGKTINSVTSELSQDPIIREYAHLEVGEDAILIYIPLTDSLLHGMAETKAAFMADRSKFDLMEYLKGYQVRSMFDKAIENARDGKTPITDAYWALHFPLRPDSNVEGNVGGLQSMTLTYRSLGLTVTFVNGALYSYIAY